MDAIDRGVIALDDWERRVGRAPSPDSEDGHERFLATIANMVALLTNPLIEVPPGAVEHMDRLVREYERGALDQEDRP